MTITGSENTAAPRPKEEAREPDGGAEDKVFTGESAAKEAVVPEDEVPQTPRLGLGSFTRKRPVVITYMDKMAFIDSIVNNTRFEKEYRLFGGKVSVTFRSLTSDESAALGAYILKAGTENPTEQMSGVNVKYILLASVSRFNGVDIPPLAMPLFETLGDDGKTVTKPGWVESASFWEGRPVALIQALSDLMNEFNDLYSTMCSKAEDENFWSPDTP